MKDSNHSICPKCASIIPSEAPDGLCPKCALEGAATVSTPTSGGRQTSPPSIAEIAPHFPELEILELIGAGGMGAVYKARQPQLARFVALKILSHDLAGDAAFVERFDREAKVLARLSHPNIIGIHDFGTAGPYCYLTMEYVDGVNLRQAMQAGRFTPTEALAMVQHLCAALKFAHEEGILHRDIKPENILIDSKGRVKIADFGIAKLVGEDRRHDFTLTMQGSVLGSPHYMAPEQIETPGDVDQRADIYSLGVVLYEMLTGGLPIGRFALPSQKAEMDARIDHIVMRTLEKEREARYQSAGEVGTEVEALGKSPAPIASGSTPAVVGSGMARFSLLSAILTGLSLVLAAVLVAINISVNASSPGQDPYIITGSPMFLLGLPAAITGIIGFILGVRALGGIRRSGGAKGGLASTLFGVTAWPILFLFAITLFSFSVSGLSWRWVLILPLSALIGLISGILLVWASRRWALGITREKGSPFRPGLGLTLVMVALLTIAAPYLISKSLNSLGLISFADSVTEFMPSHEDHIDWHRGEAELAFPVYVDSAIRAEFYLVLKNELGQPKEYSRIGTWEGSGSQSVKAGMIKIGTVGPEDADPDSVGGFAVHLDFTGESGEIRGVPDFDKWQLKVKNLPIRPYDKVGNYTILLGEFIKFEDEITSNHGILALEVRVTPIPYPTNPEKQ